VYLDWAAHLPLEQAQVGVVSRHHHHWPAAALAEPDVWDRTVTVAPEKGAFSGLTAR